MGEVYKARDTRLHRTVAIKVSRSQFSERFTREAKVISSLNHPNICALYDVGTQDGLHYLVMEYLEGKPLEGPLPLEKLQRYGMEVAAALDAAHRKGVTHRDLKPDNILVTAAGVKLLDFGLAKTADQPGPLDATVRKALTQEGVVMGTFPYMAPEQLEGKDADARTDIWAFGAVLYEMATGKRAFGGQTQATVIASIMHVAPPPVTEAQPAMPAALDRIIKRALQKDPEERWQSARDLLIELRELTGPAVPPPTPGVIASPGVWRWAAVTLGPTATALTGVLLLRQPEPPQRVHFEILPPPELRFTARISRISPDGRKLLLSMGPLSIGGELYIRRLDSPTLLKLEGTRATTDAAWSPDSNAIAYLSRGRVMRVQVDGSSRQTLATISEGEGIAWGDAGILVGQQKGPLLLIPASGGTPTPATTLDGAAGHTSHSGPYPRPDGKRFAFRAQSTDRNTEGIYVGSAGGAIRKMPALTQTRNFAGFGFFPEPTGMVARRMDWDKLTATEEAITLPNGTMPSISRNGTLLYIETEPRSVAGQETAGLHLVNRAGTPLAVLRHPDAQAYGHPEFSPDGKRLLFENNGQLWVVDLARKAFTVVNKEFSWAGAWSADGRTIAFSSRGQMWQVPAEGGEPLFLGPGALHHVQMIGPREFVGDSGQGGTGTLLQHLTFGAARASRTLVSEPALNPQLAPGRKWLAYDRFAGDARSVFLQSWPDGRLTIPVPDGAGSCPRWRADGKELFFLRANGTLVSTAVIDNGDTLNFGPIQRLQQANTVNGRYAVSPDGQTFAYGSHGEGRESGSKLHVIVNWRGGK
ncbi:MAG: protein kinase [Bryobacterales bacterium]|nr:protein kinase [Bryobacterales bacterium]